jgi:hypothetical protein
MQAAKPEASREGRHCVGDSVLNAPMPVELLAGPEPRLNILRKDGVEIVGTLAPAGGARSSEHA